MPKRINLDCASSVPIDRSVIKTMNHYNLSFHGNPSSQHEQGRIVRKKLEYAREEIAKLLHCKKQEVLFVNTGTIANNIAILGVKNLNTTKDSEIIISNIEHSSVKNSALALKNQKLEILKVDTKGRIDLQKLEKSITKKTKLVSIIYANNETGVIQDIKNITKIVKRKNPDTLVHTDACQATEFLSINVKKLGVDLMSLSGAKIYGPKSTAILYAKENVEIIPKIFGGKQEQAIFPGTEDIGSILGFVTSLKNIEKNKKIQRVKQGKLQNFLHTQIKKEFPKIHINTRLKNSIPSKLHISIPSCRTNEIVTYFDQRKIYISGGSACESGSFKPSHVVEALYKNPEDYAHIRISMCKHTTKSEIKVFIKTLKKYLSETI